MYEDICDAPKAIHYYSWSLKAYETQLGAKHFKTCRARVRLASLYEEQEEYHKAEPLYKEHAQLCLKMYGFSHIETLNAFHQLATVYVSIEELEKAEAIYTKVLREKERLEKIRETEERHR